VRAVSVVCVSLALHTSLQRTASPPRFTDLKETASMFRNRIHVFGGALLVTAFALTVRLGAAVTVPAYPDLPLQPQSSEEGASRLIEQVRAATAIFRDVNQAVGYAPFGGCVSGPESGAMGVHFVNSAFLEDGEIAVDKPEALIYEFKNGAARLVGVEYIVLAEKWDPAHLDPRVPPVLEGQLFQFNDSPNRFRLPAFYELHVWAWRENPNGAFVDWNPLVSCEKQ
jgi:hypothetical protein